MSTSVSLFNRLGDAIAIFQPSNKKEWAALSLSCATLLFSRGAAMAAGISYLGYKWAIVEKLSDPNTVQTIYTPPHPTKTDLESLHVYAEKIAKLKQDPAVMGITFAPDKNGCLCPIYIESGESEDYTISFTARSLRDDTLLGSAITHPFLESNQYLEDYWLCGRPAEYAGYGASQEEVSKVWLEQVTNHSTYKNIGVILNKAIHQKFVKECQGRIIIDAARSTHPYHYKMGFRALDPEKNRLYAQYAKAREIPKADLGLVPMHLPERASELWLQEVQDHPIEFPRDTNLSI